MRECVNQRLYFLQKNAFNDLDEMFSKLLLNNESFTPIIFTHFLIFLPSFLVLTEFFQQGQAISIDITLNFCHLDEF